MTFAQVEVEGYERANGRTGRSEFVESHTRTIPLGTNGKPLPRGFFSQAARDLRSCNWATIKEARTGDETAIAKCDSLGIYWMPIT